MTRLGRHIRGFAADEEGATLVEFAVVAAVFFFILFALIDFARLGFSNVLAEKATESAVRMAVVRPAACGGVPAVNRRGLIGTLSIDVPNGTLCTEREGLCQEFDTVSCTGSAGNPTSAAVWAQVQNLLPVNARPENLRFSYSFDPALNRVGAPYAPVVTVELADLQFDFISPLGAMAAVAGADNASGLGSSFVFPSMSASLPSETIR